MANSVKLSETQQTIVDFKEGALLVVAGPGSGKTRVLTERVRKILLTEGPNIKVLALTFTNKAANEMKERLQEFPDINNRAFIGTLHSFCAEVLTNRGKSVGIMTLPNIFELFKDQQQILLRAVSTDPLLTHELQNSGNMRDQDRHLSKWLSIISELKNQLILPEMVDDEVMRRVYQSYDAELRASDAVDYDDLLLLTYRLLTERQKIAEFYRRQYQYIFIDEAQDLNEAQYKVIQALCGDNFQNIMMVGDPRQAIFVWNGANPKYLDLFEKDFKAVRIRLSENFRSSKCVVKAAKALSSDFNIEGQLAVEGEIRLITGKDEGEEADLVIRYIQSLLDNGHPDIEGKITLDQCALLARNRYVFSTISDKLNEKEWPYYKQLSSQQESESDLIKDFELCLRLISNPRDQLHLSLLLKRWNIRDNESLIAFRQNNNIIEYLSHLANTEKQFAVITSIKALNYTENNIQFLPALDRLIQFSDNLDNEDEKALVLEDIKYWRKNWDLYLRSQSNYEHNLSAFLGQVALGATQQMRQDGLGLVTVHSAKGLEFDVVVIMGLVEGIFPDYRATGQSLEEEKRNAFVAVTRSKRLLALSYSKTRIMPWGDLKKQKPSRYLREIGII